MDSFYDAPRRPPAPMFTETLAANAAVPVVPEISVLCSSNAPGNAFIPYSQWKNQHNAGQNHFVANNKENINFTPNPQNNSILKKQVRFESPVLQQKFDNVGNQQIFNQIPKDKPQPQLPSQNAPAKTSGGLLTFEQMYMANIPNRKLDLSVIDIPKKVEVQNITENQNKKLSDQALRVPEQADITNEKTVPRTYKEFLESQKKTNNIILNDSVTDIFNYKRNVINQGCSRSPNIQVPNNVGVLEKQADNKNPHIREKSDQFFNEKEHKQSQHDLEYGRNMIVKPRPSSEDFNQEFAQRLTTEGSSKNILSKESYSCKNPTIQNEYPSHYPPYIFTRMDKPNSDMEHNTSSDQRQSNGGESKGESENLKNTKVNQSQQDKEQKNKCGCDCRSESNALKLKSDDDFSAKDLLKIIAQQSQQIAQQNTQLLMLQQQVTKLVLGQSGEEINQPKSIEGRFISQCCCQHDRCYKNNKNVQQTNVIASQRHNDPVTKCFEQIQDKCITSTQHEIQNGERRFVGTPRKNKNQVPNFSIGMTTSFEVSFKRPQRNNYQEDRPLDCESEPPKIQEVTESDLVEIDRNHRNDNKETLVDTSMVFKEPIRVRETIPSPEPTININMNDFEDSDSDDESTNVEASFYKKLMAQVNKILQKAQIETAEQMAYKMGAAGLNNKTMHKVKEATLKHLRKIGVEMPNFEDSSQNSSSSEESDGKSYREEDISFAVKQLLMKYLPADHLAKVASKDMHAQKNRVLIPKEKVGAIKTRPEFSFATLQYMQKYNLIANGEKGFTKPQRQSPSQSPKVLDISKLKQQPKLL